MPITNPGMPGMVGPGQIYGRPGSPRYFPPVFRPPQAAPFRQGPPPAPAFRPPMPVRPPSNYSPPTYGPPRVQPANYGPPNPPSRSFPGSGTANPNLPLDPRAQVYPLITSGIYTPAAQDLFRNRVSYSYNDPSQGGLTSGSLLTKFTGQGSLAVRFPRSDMPSLQHELGHVYNYLASNPFGRRAFYRSASGTPQPNVSIPGSYLNEPFPGMYGNPRGDWGGPDEYYAELAAYPYTIPPALRDYYPQYTAQAYGQ